MPMPAAASRSPFRRGWPLLLVIAALAAAGGWWWSQRGATPAGGYRTATVERGDIRVSISATGTLSAISTVTVGSQVSGQITEVLVDFNSKVKKGDILARIDPSTYQAQIAQGSAQIASARAQLAQAQATLRNAGAVHARNAALAGQQLISRNDLEQSRTAMAQAEAQVAAAQAAIRAQTAATQTTRVNLDRTVIRSPVDGVVLTRAIEPGQTVAASMQAPTLFTIAEDLSQMKIQLAVDESDIGQVREGQAVSFTVDAFPDRPFKGRVAQVQLAATTTNNVVTYPVIVSVENADGQLLPGLTVNAEIEVSRQANVLRIANAALRWKPSDETATAPAGAGAGGASRAGAGMGEDLRALAATLALRPEQQAAFDAAMAQMRERQQQQQQRQQQAGAQQGSRLFGGGQGMGPPRGGAAASGAMAAQMRARMRERFQQQFAAFQAGLDADQRARWEAGVAALLNARRATVYLLVDGRPRPAMVRLGASDGTYTQVAGAVKEGDRAITGMQTAAAAK